MAVAQSLRRLQLRRSLLIAVLVVPLVTPAASVQAEPPRYDPAWHSGIAVGSLLASIVVVARERHRAPVCQWCGVSEDGEPRAPRVDHWAWSHWHWKDGGRASAISHGTVAAAIAWPMIALTAVHDGVGGEWGRDQVVATESVLIGLLSADLAKRLARRSRPAVVFEREPIRNTDDVHSFFSSHASTAFAAAAAAGTIASRRHSADASWIWAGGLGLAGTTSYLRVAATRHYFSDVLVGSAVGTAVGMILPRVFDEWHVPDGSAQAAVTTSPLVGLGPVVRVGPQTAAAPRIQFAAGARSLGVVGTVDLR